MKTLFKILVACVLVAGVSSAQASTHGGGHSGHGGFGHGWGGGRGYGGWGHGWGGYGWGGRGWGWGGYGWGLGWPYYWGGYPGYGYGYPGYYGYPAYGYSGYGYPGYGSPAYGYGAPPRGNGGGGQSMAAGVQAALSSRGYSTGGVDGVIGPQSRAAIRHFQASHRLPVTGNIDQALLRSLGLG